MIYECIDTNNRQFNLYNPVSAKLSIEEETPADSLDITFAIDLTNIEEKTFPEIKYIKVFDDKNKILVFNGILDEQIVKISQNGAYLELHARSMAALLLDNEANPCVYSLPSLKDIFKNHIEQYGFAGFNGNEESFSKPFEVNKGTSQWEALSRFCKEYLNAFPRVEPSTFINITKNYNEKEICFSNELNDSINYLYISENTKRFKVISEVNLRCSKDGVYSTTIVNEKSKNRDIKRKRYIDPISSSDPVYVADNIINKSNLDSYEIKIICPGFINLSLYDCAQIKDKILGYIDKLYVSAINYSINSSLEKCEITLKKRN